MLIRNPTCGDSTGSNQIENGWVGVPSWLVWGKGGGRVVWLSVCEAPLDDWANGGSVFFTYGEYGFSSVVFKGQKYVTLLKGSKMATELRSRNLILGINRFTIFTLNV